MCEATSKERGLPANPFRTRRTWKCFRQPLRHLCRRRPMQPQESPSPGPSSERAGAIGRPTADADLRRSEGMKSMHIAATNATLSIAEPSHAHGRVTRSGLSTVGADTLVHTQPARSGYWRGVRPCRFCSDLDLARRRIQRLQHPFEQAPAFEQHVGFEHHAWTQGLVATIGADVL